MLFNNLVSQSGGGITHTKISSQMNPGGYYSIHIGDNEYVISLLSDMYGMAGVGIFNKDTILYNYRPAHVTYTLRSGLLYINYESSGERNYTLEIYKIKEA